MFLDAASMPLCITRFRYNLPIVKTSQSNLPRLEEHRRRTAVRSRVLA